MWTGPIPHTNMPVRATTTSELPFVPRNVAVGYMVGGGAEDNPVEGQLWPRGDYDGGTPG